MMLAAITLHDAQVIGAVVTLYTVAVAFTGKVIMHLVERNKNLEVKVDGLHKDLNELHTEVRDLARAAFRALESRNGNDDAVKQ